LVAGDIMMAVAFLVAGTVMIIPHHRLTISRLALLAALRLVFLHSNVLQFALQPRFVLQTKAWS